MRRTCFVLLLAASVAMANEESKAPDGAADQPSTSHLGETHASVPDQASRRPNVVVISLDTLRADRLGAYGYARPTSPAIDALAARGVRFEWMLAASPWTLPSHVTLFSGRQPEEHGVTDRGKRIPADVPLLAQVLRQNGYATRGIAGGGYVHERYGFARGFDRWTTDGMQTDFGRAVATVRDEIDSLVDEQPFFLFLHTYATHCPFTIDPAHAATLAEGTTAEDQELECTWDVYGMSKKPRVLSDLYDASVRTVDDRVAELVQLLQEKGLDDHTIFILTSDHGEEFGEHGYVGHGLNLHLSALRIPLVIVAPGIAPRVVTEPVTLADVMPTILEMLDIPDAQEASGRSLLSLMRGTSGAVASGPRFVTSHLAPQAFGSYVAGADSIVALGEQLITGGRPGDAGVYLLEEYAQVPAPAPRPAQGSEKASLLAGLREANPVKSRKEQAPVLEPGALSAEGRARLRALGYVE